MSNSIKDSAQAFAVNQVLKYVDSNPQEAFPKLLDWADKFDKDNLYLTQRQQIRKVMEQPDSNWMRLINSLWTDIDSEVRKVFFRNFIVNASLLGSRKQVANREKYGCNIPWAILMDPTSACNLHCTGCWAAEYGNKLNLSYEELDDIINQANELGTYMFLYTGGEPMVRKNDLLRLCEAHPDCVFSAFTNGTLIDEKFADEMLRVKNFYPAISIEGFEEATDFRRGKGTYQATMRAMKILKEKKLPFGVSGCYTSKNIDSISSDEFFDHLVECGAKFAWFFHYMPVGNDSAVELLPSPDQREKMYNRICEYRSTKPIFTIDFQNDAKFVNGCIAGGRNYLHINANGDIEPCAVNPCDTFVIVSRAQHLFEVFECGALCGVEGKRVEEVLLGFRVFVENIEAVAAEGGEFCSSFLSVREFGEAFLELRGMNDIDFDAYAKEISAQCWKMTSIPVSVGIAPTKTLAKIASKLCKQYT